MKQTALLFISLLLVICSTTNLRSQDTLIMKSGQRIATKIMEISPTEVKYKKADNPDGPTFISNASDINIIKYMNGSSDTLRVQPTKVVSIVQAAPVVPKVVDLHPPIWNAGPFFKSDGRIMKIKEVYYIMGKVNDPDINMHVKKARNAKNLKLIGFLAIPGLIVGAGGIIWGIGAEDETGFAVGIPCAAVGALALATNITFSAINKKHNQAAIRLYNEKY